MAFTIEESIRQSVHTHEYAWLDAVIVASAPCANLLSHPVSKQFCDADAKRLQMGPIHNMHTTAVLPLGT